MERKHNYKKKPCKLETKQRTDIENKREKHLTLKQEKRSKKKVKSKSKIQKRRNNINKQVTKKTAKIYHSSKFEIRCKYRKKAFKLQNQFHGLSKPSCRPFLASRPKTFLPSSISILKSTSSLVHGKLIHLVFTFFNNFIPFVSIRCASVRNSMTLQNMHG